MSWRTVVISSRCKLDLKMGYLVARGESIQRVFLDEIAILLIETDKKQTPFTNKNVKILKIVDILVVLLWLFGHIGIIIPVMTTTFYWIFKYGCFLQKDSDETL